jgi:hypothetical protein
MATLNYLKIRRAGRWFARNGRGATHKLVTIPLLLVSYLLSLEFRNPYTIVAYRFHRAILHRFLALAFFFRRLWLFEDK